MMDEFPHLKPASKYALYVIRFAKTVLTDTQTKIYFSPIICNSQMHKLKCIPLLVVHLLLSWLVSEACQMSTSAWVAFKMALFFLIKQTKGAGNHHMTC